MSRYFVLILLSFFCGGCSASETQSPCSNVAVSQLFSNYSLHDVVRYGGGLTSEDEVREILGKEIKVAKGSFEMGALIISNPNYNIYCHPRPVEGEVDAGRWSNFYGFSKKRKAIEILEVYSKGDTEGEPSVDFEIVNGQLWEMYDGWLFRYEPNQ